MRFKNATCLIAFSVVLLGCTKPKVEISTSPNSATLLYSLPLGYRWLNNFPHNSLHEITSFEIAENDMEKRNLTPQLAVAYKRFKSLFKPGDALWTWSGPNAEMFPTFNANDIPAGLCIARRSKIIATIKTHTVSNTE